MNHTLSRQGFILKKTKENLEEISRVKSELTVKPYQPFSFGKKEEEPPYPVYLEDDENIYLPRFYALEKYGKPKKTKKWNNQDVKITFKGNLRDYQNNIINQSLPKIKETGGGMISLRCGGGKCLGKGTEILMFDGTIKKVEDVVVGDLLMGDDSTPRKVLTLARGREMMYRINDNNGKGHGYIVNESHILSLKCGTNRSKKLKKGDIVDISVKDFLNLPSSYHGRGGVLYGYRVPIIFPEKDIEIDPYLFGYWLGDGHSYSTQISTQESRVIKYIVECFKNKHKELYLIHRSNYDYSINGIKKNNIFRNFLNKYNLLKNKHIPFHYKCNSRKNQLELLAGIIDSDGYNHNNCFEITQKNEKLLDDIIYLSRSLGFSAFKKKREKICTNAKNGAKKGIYFSTTIYGSGLEQIPVKCIRKKAHSRQQIKDALNYRIRPEKLQEDDYYGFEIDGNRRFVLGDFTVTHNTVLALYLACQLKKKTLIMVHKTFLLNQWIERIEQFTDAKVGIIMQDKVEVEGKDIVIGMLQSISKDKYDEKLFQQFGLVIFDEAHHAPSRFFSRSLPMIASEYCLALSATPKRSDKLEKIIFWYMGNIVYQEADNIKRDVLVKMYHYKSDNKKFREAKLPYTGEPNLPRTINWITELESRNKLIIDLIEEIIQEDNRHILVLSDRIKHLEELKKLLDERKITESDFYIGKMKQKDLDTAKDKPVLFGSYAMASEALDIPTLNCLVMTTSRRNIEQSVGRILRTQNSNIQPLIIDFNDELNCFQTQGRGRIKFYQKKDYKIMKILTKEDKILEERELGKQIFPEKINLDEVDFID